MNYYTSENDKKNLTFLLSTLAETSDMDFLICFDLIRRKSIKKGSVHQLSYIVVTEQHVTALQYYSTPSILRPS